MLFWCSPTATQAFQKVANTLQTYLKDEDGQTVVRMACDEDGDDAADAAPPSGLSLHGSLSAVTSRLLIQTLVGIPVRDLNEAITKYLTAFDQTAAAANQKASLFLKSKAFPSVLAIDEEISTIKAQLQEHLGDVRKQLRNSAIEYKSVSGTDYLIEVPLKVPGFLRGTSAR